MLFEKYKEIIYRLALVAAMSFVLSLLLFAPASAAEYDCGAYGAGTFGEGQVCASSTDDSNSGSKQEESKDSDSLINTGQALSVGIPATMILAGTFMLYRLNHKKKSQ